jgi:hypothetical protein
VKTCHDDITNDGRSRTFAGRTFASAIAISLMVVFSGADRTELAILAQPRQEPGRSIGAISTQGDLIVMTLDEGVLGSENLFDLGGRTLRFTPAVGGYRGENLPLQWDAEFGAEMSDASATLQRFAFPFSGERWKQLSVGVNGSITFGPTRGVSPSGGAAGGGTGRGGGVSIGRFDQLQNAASALVNTVPAICVFMKPRMSGKRHLKELPDRAVITWSLTEPVGGIQDFTWQPTINRFQAVLFKDGTIELAYQQVAAKDAIVGIYPMVRAGKVTPIAALKDPEDTSLAPHLDLRSVKLAAIDGLFLNVTFETRGPLLPPGDPAANGLSYLVRLQSPKTTTAGRSSANSIVWTVRGGAGGGRGGGASRYTSAGPGASPEVTVRGNTISLRGVLPVGSSPRDQIAVSAEVTAGESARPADQVPVQSITLSGIRSAHADLSSLARQDGPFAVLYEPFHYVALPNPRDLTCTVIKTLGDRFDFLAYYSDFRIDNQEAGTPSTGPRGGGPEGGAVTGIGVEQRSVASYCSNGRFQWQFVQPVYVGSNQMAMYPPDGVSDDNQRNIVSYARQLGRRSPDGRMLPYNYGISQIAHELGHRWSASASARVNGEVIPLGPTHWARGLHAPAAFPYQRPYEASAMGGGVWQDNFDGTFTQLDDDYYVPATGWSHLELYLMGLSAASEVPDFFILRNLAPAGRDDNGHSIFKADRTKVTIADVIAAEGPRRPDVDHAQKQFNTGIVVIVEHGKTPSQALIDRQWHPRTVDRLLRDHDRASRVDDNGAAVSVAYRLGSSGPIVGDQRSAAVDATCGRRATSRMPCTIRSSSGRFRYCSSSRGRISCSSARARLRSLSSSCGVTWGGDSACELPRTQVV